MVELEEHVDSPHTDLGLELTIPQLEKCFKQIDKRGICPSTLFGHPGVVQGAVGTWVVKGPSSYPEASDPQSSSGAFLDPPPPSNHQHCN
eukprot:10159523-Heterocapsa_arctica.AAC.1